MRPATTTLSIPQPCAQSWDAMTPTAAGRHCAACQKTVIDFSQHTDAEILAVLARATGETCARLRPEQLGRPLRPLLLPAPSRWRAWLAAAVAVWGLREVAGTGARGQVKPEQEASPVVLGSKIGSPVNKGTGDLSFILRGSIIDSVSSEALPGTTIVLDNTTIGTSSNVDGSFELQLPEATRNRHHIVVKFLNLGYLTQTKIISLIAVQQKVQVKLVADNRELGEMVVVGGLHYRRPWPWHPRALYHWAKFWLTRPFN